jgi:hypothetical protein
MRLSATWYHISEDRAPKEEENKTLFKRNVSYKRVSEESIKKIAG